MTYEEEFQFLDTLHRELSNAKALGVEVVFITVDPNMVEQLGMACGHGPGLSEKDHVQLLGFPVLQVPGENFQLYTRATTGPMAALVEHIQAYYDAHRKLPRKLVVPEALRSAIPGEWHMGFAAPMRVTEHVHNIILMGS